MEYPQHEEEVAKLLLHHNGSLDTMDGEINEESKGDR
jgi:hypothetical protein